MQVRVITWILGVVLAAAVPMAAADAQQVVCVVLNCSVGPGAFSTPSDSAVPNYGPATPEVVSLSNTAAFSVNTPTASLTFLGAIWFGSVGATGASSSSDDAGAGAPALTLSATGATPGGITHTLQPNYDYGASIATARYYVRGGDGGNYTAKDAKHNGGPAGDAYPVTLTNNQSITTSHGTAFPSGLPYTAGVISGAALLADSVGGKGGSVTSMGPDGNGNPTYHNQIGYGGGVADNVTLYSNATVVAQNIATSLGYWAVAGRSLGGDGGTGNDGTPGGSAGTIALYTSAPVSLSLNWIEPPSSDSSSESLYPGGYAVHARSQGGRGNMSVNSGNDGGAGGTSGGAGITICPTAPCQNANVTLTVSNTLGLPSLPVAAAVSAMTLGGAGGAGYDSSTGGAGGSTGSAAITINGATIVASGPLAMGVVARAWGGFGGDSGVGQDHSAAGAGGSTGTVQSAAASAFMQLTSTTVQTSGTGAPAIVGESLGGAGGDGLPYSKALAQGVTAGMGGAGGSTGPVNLHVSGGSITTPGPQRPGIIALALGGHGGVGGNLAAGEGHSGTGGAGGPGSNVFVTVQSGTVITTTGGPSTGGSNPSFGIFASSIGGAGGTGGSINVDEGGGIGDGGAGGSAGIAEVILDSGVQVITSGTGAIGVFARSIGGAGGAGSINNQSGGVATNPGNGGVSGASGPVTVSTSGVIQTSGAQAHGIVAQSMSGVSGDGGNGTGVFYGPGGSGGAVGTVGSVTVMLNNGASISTAGQGAFGVQAQAIGGATGSGGSSDGGFVTLGGSSGAAAAGGAVTVTSSGQITTAADYAGGILAQSIGGGGGNGGTSSGVLASIGGNGGDGGAGNTVTFSLHAGSVTTGGDYAPGVLLHSIGGGGGVAGASRATGSELAVTVGGTGGSGGDAGQVTVTGTGGLISTNGSNAGGLIAQSIGGGGGAGGAAYTNTVSLAFSASIAVGGNGGQGGSSAGVNLQMAGLTVKTGQNVTSGVNTNPVDSYGIVAQSIGGGGGNGGSASARGIAITIPDPDAAGNFSAAIAASVGGKGGSAGNGGTVIMALTGNTTVTTQGQGSHGVVAQSIGGGGGTGGDSSALATTLSFGRAITISNPLDNPPPAGATTTNTYSAQVAVAVGGAGGGGGTGGTVRAGIEASNVTTYGDYANAMLVQSIGGGGGNAGAGSTTTGSFGSTRSLTLGLTLGAQGGTGGDGGSVQVGTDPRSVIATYGASAMGVVAQSIGGGGGASQGGTINLGGSYSYGDTGSISPTAALVVNLGVTGGAGGAGGQVGPNIYGTINTQGGDATGVLIQSIGGGGGVGGSAGGDASSDLPVSVLTHLREEASNAYESNLGFGMTATLNLGGTGGSGNSGGSIEYFQGAQITTQGDWAQGGVLQSIGGGGGKAGSAASATSGLGVGLSFALGGTGGAGGDGGAIYLNLLSGSSVTTGSRGSAGVTGYAAFGLLAQSIGGGGGLGADGSAASTGLLNIGGGTNIAGSGGSAGGGGYVSLQGTTQVTTYGDVASAIVLQSIGGGGGLAGTGSSQSLGIGLYTGTINLRVGGANGSSGSGGQIAVGASDSGVISYADLGINTAGANAYGLLAQSIGGGGGFGFTTAGPSTVVNSVGATGNSTGAALGNGGPVGIYIAGTVYTKGFAAHGIVAQSIGGGGGIAGFPVQGMTLSQATGSTNAVGNGGAISIGFSGQIATAGTGAFGILAQSIGAGGGMMASGSTLYVGSTGGSGSSGSGGAIDIQFVSGTIATPAANAVGIFAQSQGRTSGGGSANGTVTMTIGSLLQGGSGANGYGIWIDSGTTGNLVTIGDLGNVSAASGNAIHYSGDALLNVHNGGTLSGNVQLSGGAGTGTVTNTAIFAMGDRSVAHVVNAGVLTMGSPGDFSASRIEGSLTQTAPGVLVVDADFAGGRSDTLRVAGPVTLDGRVRPRLVTILPGSVLPFLRVDGAISGALAGEDSPVFRYAVTRAGGSFLIGPTSANFLPAGFALGDTRAAVAAHVQGAWNAGGNTATAPLFALLGNAAALGPGPYAAALRQLSPDSTFAAGARAAAGAQAFASTALSCPRFDGTTAMLTEGQCAWLRVTGWRTSQDSDNGLTRFRVDTTTWQIGGQKSLGEGWLLGGSLAYETSWLSSADALNTGKGQGGHAAVTLKYQTGPWLFAAAGFGGAGSFSTFRVITLPGFGSVAKGSPATAQVGLLLRAAYTIGREDFYLRPMLSMAATHARSGAYREQGGTLNLAVDAASQGNATLSPMLEVGGRVALDADTLLRPFLAIGIDLNSATSWSQTARLAIAPAGAGVFTTRVPVDRVLGRVTLGAQLYTGREVDLRLQYDGGYGGSLMTHAGSVVVSARF